MTDPREQLCTRLDLISQIRPGLSRSDRETLMAAANDIRSLDARCDRLARAVEKQHELIQHIGGPQHRREADKVYAT